MCTPPPRLNPLAHLSAREKALLLEWGPDDAAERIELAQMRERIDEQRHQKAAMLYPIDWEWQRASETVKCDMNARELGVESYVSESDLLAALNVLAGPPKMPVWSEADKTRLAGIRARQAERTAKYERRQALRPTALFSRLKARVARVSWDSWG